MKRPAEAWNEREALSLSKAAEYLLHECRMVLPGIQALFGFQLVAVFSQRFDELTGLEQELHLTAIALTTLAIALIMTPAAYHRHRGGREITSAFVIVTRRLLVTSMLPLAVALTLDVFLIALMILERGAAMTLAALTLLTLGFFWVVFPRVMSHRESAR
jgi:hypothetical protein